MRQRTFALALLLAACGGAVPYGSFVQGREPAQAAIATDAAKKLADAFPEEGHAVRFAHDVQDAFGRGLASELRKAGFAIRSTPTEGELLVRYVADAIHGTDLLRATIYVRGRTFSRAYALRGEQLRPVGPWSVGVRHGS